MFGHQNDVITQDQHADASVPLPESTINALTSAPAITSETDSPAPAASAPAITPTQPISQPVSQPQPTVVTPTNPQSTDGFFGASTQSGNPSSFPSYVPAPSTTTPDPLPKEEPAAATVTTPPTDDSSVVKPTETPPVSTATATTPDDLMKIKQEALQSLSPLVGKLDVGPEEKFRTLMMLIQASDDHGKLTEAYEVAKTIQNEKARAQALLDVVNEINYFTTKSK